ncbi:glycyl aminopeptidase. Metallo peptidase. MEROPS family M61 [Bryocella elongata]|uniref:Glycyl aminopeptidase. Metallo peptidase. MEROPS family M61 n=1 Tax=Bryocella elongata TaxID=863522 RepID=A0A1H5T9L8_9BACT|nr:M61 family metallopeptidase [Bryocella elongata]SEF58781.1 glycyl aminopeptidase. Metallo peptidase. MEROPS family M61 [Bryocella elongata]
MAFGTALLAPALLIASGAIAQTPIRITADLTDAPRKLYHAEIDLPVQPGSATFTTPKWIPGNHRPTGPVSDITGVVFTANGKTLPWRRDDVDLYQYHVEVPAGVTTLHAHLDCIVTSRASDYMAVLEWEKLMLYPAGIPVKQIAIQPSVTVPQGWGLGTALQPVKQFDANTKPGGTVQYQATTVEQLEDSPVIAGAHFHEFALAPEISPKHYLDVVSDEAHDEDLNPETIDAANNLIREASAAYASHHYNVYHLLLTLSDVAGGEGLEHGQSSDNGVGEKGFASPASRLGNSDLLAHEFTHSWNGKYRRPDKLYQTDFATAQVGELLWVYEGMTQYMGNVLAARSGLETVAQYRDRLAMTAANLDYKSGRQWRSTDDTALAASILRSEGPEWGNWRRGQDYYAEGELLWLDVDTLIRQLTNDKKNIADFHKLFLAKGGNTGPLIVTYDRQELIDDLNQVAPYDWKMFLHERVDDITPHADVAGIERGGYKLEYKPNASKSETMIAQARARRPGGGGPSVWYSLGLQLKGDGSVSDVRWGSVADKAKLAPGEKLIGVNGWVYSADALHSAIVDAMKSTQPIHFIVQSQDKLHEVDVDYHDGERHPVLVRTDGTKDYLDEILAPLTQHPPASKPAKSESDSDSN